MAALTTLQQSQVLFPETSTSTARRRRRGQLIRFQPRRSSQFHSCASNQQPTSQDDYSVTDRKMVDSIHLSPIHGRRSTILHFMATLPIIHHFPDAALAAQASEISTVQGELSKVMSKSKAAGMLRLAFHDAGTFDMLDNTGGMNGSIIHELDRPENIGLSKTVKILDKVKGEVASIQQVSWADLIAVAGAEAVALCGGPKISVRLGRLDTGAPDPEGKLPLESQDANSLKSCFLQKGFTTQELVALSGAHTLGNKGFGNPNSFDNAYFKILLEKPWMSGGMESMIGLPSDHALADDDECLRWIKMYAEDEQLFFSDFASVYVKLVNCGAHWKSS